jgi:hypothetical protein
MTTSHLSRITRTLVVAAVLVGAIATAASAAVSRPPDVRDAAASVAWQSAAPDVLERFAAAHPYGAGVSNGKPAPTRATAVGRPPDVADAARAAHTISLGSPDGFDWGDFGIGIGTGVGLILFLGGALVARRQHRHQVQTA